MFHRYVYINSSSNIDEISNIFLESNNQIKSMIKIDDNSVRFTETSVSPQCDFSYEEFYELLTMDFEINMKIYISRFIKESYINEKIDDKLFEFTNKLSPKVYYFDDIIHHVFIKETDTSLYELLPTILDGIDNELINTIKTFINCNMNNTLTAKRLYLHRNSLNYRINKFVEQTGIDVKTFKGASAVNLILLIKK